MVRKHVAEFLQAMKKALTAEKRIPGYTDELSWLTRDISGESKRKARKSNLDA